MDSFVIYARCSRWDNDESLGIQINRCKKYGKNHGMKHAETFIDRVSGHVDRARLSSRKGLVTLMQYVMQYQIKVVIVRDITRLSRSVLEGSHFLHWFLLSGVVVHDVDYVSKVGNFTPSHRWEYRKELYQRLIEGESYYHTTIMQQETESDILYKGKKLPWGYKPEGSLPSRLMKDTTCESEVTVFFELLLANAKKTITERNKKRSVSYSQLFDVLASSPHYPTITESMIREGKKPMDVRRLMRTIKNPIYAGYPFTGELTTDQCVHEPYITASQFNRLNLGHGISIHEKKSHASTYLPLVSCGCGKGKLNHNSGLALCKSCHAYIKERDLRSELSSAFSRYRVDKDDQFHDSMVSSMKIHRFAKVVEEWLSSLDMMMDPGGTRYSAYTDPKTKTTLREIKDAIKEFTSLGAGDLAVLWEECRDHQERRQLIQRFALNIECDLKAEKGKRITVKQENREINKKNDIVGKEPLHPLVRKGIDNAESEVAELVKYRRNIAADIQKKMELIPGLVARLEYEMGYAAGDFWTSYTSMLLE